jgi:hypothetical protein
MKITGAHDAGVGERRGCFMKGVMAFIICIMFGKTLLPRLRRCSGRSGPLCSVTQRICPFDGLAAITYFP